MESSLMTIAERFDQEVNKYKRKLLLTVVPSAEINLLGASFFYSQSAVLVD